MAPPPEHDWREGRAMIVRSRLDTGEDTYASMADQLGDLKALAGTLLVALSRAACLQVWADGKSFLNPPDAKARPPAPDPAPGPSTLALDVVTAIMLREADQTAILTGAPSWLRRDRSAPRSGPRVLWGRATGATDDVPPV
jgi:hypothetical protein